MTRPALHQASERSTYADPTKTMGASGEPTAKRAKKDKEDPLVRRRNELILGVAHARAEGMRLVREAEEKAERLKREAEETLAQHMPSVCAELEAANRDELLKKLPPEL